MDWTMRLNRVLDYIENNLDADIDLNYASRLAFCSVNSLQSAFNVMTGMQLNEYIRKRRLSIAALEIQSSKDKVIDIGLKYGYSSPTAFNRAFQNQHKVSPQYARSRRVSLAVFPRISIQIKLKGDIEMKCKIEQKDAFTVMGVKTHFIYDNNNPKKFWLETSKDVYDQIASIANAEPRGMLGIVANFGDTGFDYFIAAATTKEAPPDKIEKYEVPASTWAIFESDGDIPDLISRFRDEWLPSSGYIRAEYDLPDIEIYHNGDLRNNSFGYELWFPVLKE